MLYFSLISARGLLLTFQDSVFHRLGESSMGIAEIALQETKEAEKKKEKKKERKKECNIGYRERSEKKNMI